MPEQPEIIFDVERMRYPNTGLYYYCLNLAEALINLQPKFKYELGLYAPENECGIFESKAPLKFFNKGHKFLMPLSNAKLWHCTFQGSNYFPFSNRIKSVLTIHDINFVREKINVNKQKKYTNNLQKKITKADKIITISNFVKAEIVKKFAIDENKVQTIYNGCNINDELKSTKPKTNTGKPFIFTIGVIAAKKNFHVLAGLLKNNNYELIIAGKIIEPDYKEKIIQYAKDLGVINRLIFAGEIFETEKYWYLQNCVAFCFPSLAEGFGLPVIEAMHFGKPVILSTSTSLPEIGGNNAYYFDSFEPQNMQQTLEKSLNDYSKNNKAEEIINWSKKFDWKITAQQHWELYESILNDKK